MTRRLEYTYTIRYLTEQIFPITETMPNVYILILKIISYFCSFIVYIIHQSVKQDTDFSGSFKYISSLKYMYII